MLWRACNSISIPARMPSLLLKTATNMPLRMRVYKWEIETCFNCATLKQALYCIGIHHHQPNFSRANARTSMCRCVTMRVYVVCWRITKLGANQPERFGVRCPFGILFHLHIHTQRNGRSTPCVLSRQIAIQYFYGHSAQQFHVRSRTRLAVPFFVVCFSSLPADRT